MGLFAILHQTSHALTANSAGVQVTSNNTANANTQGYSRQYVAIDPAGVHRRAPGGILLGQGVVASSVLSAYDGFSESEVLSHLGTNAYAESQGTSFAAVETLFEQGQGSDLGAAVAAFLDSFAALEGNPHLDASRLEVISSGQDMVNQFNQIAADLDRRQQNADMSIVMQVETVNRLATDIAALNDQIVNLEAGGAGGGGGAHNLRAERVALVEQLAELGPVQIHENFDGALSVLLGAHTLVEGDTTRLLSAVSDPVTGFNQIHLSMGSTTMEITSSLTTGKMAALLDERDTQLQGLETDLDDLAFEISQQVNAVHVAGVGLDGLTGRNFFGTLGGSAGAANAISLDAAVVGTPDAIAASATVGGLPGDNANAAALAGLADVLTMAGGNQTFTHFYSSMLAQLGQDSKAAQNNATRAQLQLETAKDIRDSISGVSMEEEALNLLRFQDAYHAAARVMSTARDMLEELLRIFA